MYFLKTFSAAAAVSVSFLFAKASPILDAATHISSADFEEKLFLPKPPKGGWNNWHCILTPAHPTPIVMVHGLGSTDFATWAYMGPRLASEGYCVYSLTYGKVFDEAPIGGVTSMEDSSKELAVFVDKVLNSTGASKVNLLGHCEGSIMPRYYLKFLGGAAKVDKYAALAPVGSGTTMSGIVILAKAFNIYDAVHNTVYPGCSSCTEILINSTFIQNLNADGETVPGVKYLFVATKYDLVITPPSNGFLHDNSPNVINHWLQDWCSVAVNGHSDITLSPVAFAGVNAFFDSHAPQSISCTS